MHASLQSLPVRLIVALIGATRFWRMLLLLLLLATSTLAMMPRPPDGIDFGWDKLNHVLAFAALTLSAGLGFPTRRAARLGAPLTLLAYGGLIELVQLWVPQRSGEWADLLADGLGIGCGVLIVVATLRGAARLSGPRG